MGGRGSKSGLTSSPKAPTIGQNVVIKDWFAPKIDHPQYVLGARGGREYLIEKETEKAYLLVINSETVDGEHDYTFRAWVPKSVTQTKKDYDEEERKQYLKQKAAFETGQKKYEKLIEFAKSNNIKGVRVGLRKDTILKKIKEAGLQYDY